MSAFMESIHAQAKAAKLQAQAGQLPAPPAPARVSARQITVQTFPHLKDKKGGAVKTGNVREVLEFLGVMHPLPVIAGDAPKFARTKMQASMFNVARYAEDTPLDANRADGSHQCAYWAVVGDADAMSRDELDAFDAKLDSLGVTYLKTTSFKHTPEAPRMRYVLPMDLDITPDEYRSAWDGLNHLAGGKLDSGAKDPTRRSYFPSCPAGEEAARPKAVIRGHRLGTLSDFPSADTSPKPVPVAYDLSINDDTAAVAGDWADGRNYDDCAVNDELGLIDTRPKDLARILPECEAVRYGAANQDSIPEPYWRALIGVAKHTADGRKNAHLLSCRHPEYDEAETDRKFDLWSTGPTTCANFEGFNPKACAGCKHKGKIKSPSVLGMEPNADGAFVAAKPLPPVIVEINSDTFVAPDGAGQTYIWRERTDPETGLFGVVAMAQQGFKLLHANRFVKVKKNIDGDTEESTVNAANYWVQHAGRRQFPKGVALLPEGPTPEGVYNLWRGFPIEPVPGDVSLMLEHVLMMCGGDAKVCTYLLNWLALCVQHPGTQPEVAVVARGGRGTGKGTLFRLMLALFGGHGLHITNGKLLTGDFNAHLRGALFVFVDEGYWAGDKSGEGILKGLITEPTIVINGKNKDVFVAPNRLKIAFASNEDWVVPAGSDERRYLVIDVPPTRRGDKGYFKTLYNWFEAGGKQAWLHHLLNLDISKFDPRAVPSTAALDRQKLASMSTFDRWILDCLEQGIDPTPSSTTWSEDGVVLATRHAVMAYGEFAKASGGRWAKPMSVYELGDGFKRLFNTGRAVTARVTNPPSKAWKLPGLTEARDRAALAMGLAHHVWGDA